MRSRQRGFTLIELLLVLAIIGILSAIAIPKFLGARNTAKYLGDAKANGAVITMGLESVKAEQAMYPAAGTYTWTKGVPPGTNPLPTVSIGGSKVNFVLVINADRLSYTLDAQDPDDNHSIVRIDQNGTVLN